MKDIIKIAYSLTLPPEGDKLLKGADLVLIGRKAFPTLNYRRELSGQDTVLREMARLSKALAAPTAFEVLTDNYGQKRRSVALFEGGKLLSIADAQRPFDKGESPSSGVKIIRLKSLKVGIAVSHDVKNVEVLKALSICESDVIINLYADIYDYSMANLVSAVGYLFGTATVSLTPSKCLAAAPGGATVFGGDGERGVFDLPIKKRFKEEIIKTFTG